MRFAFSAVLLVSILIFGTAPSARAAVLQVSVQNLAPVDSLALDFSYQLPAGQELSEIAIVSTSGGMVVLPQFSLQLGLGATGSAFPSFPGSFVLGTLQPGETLSFTVSGVNLLGGSSLAFGGTLFSALPVSDLAGNFTPLDRVITGSSIGEFSTDMVPRLILPDGNQPGPESITPTTGLLRLTVVPEPATASMLGVVFALGLRRRRSPLQ